MHTDADDISRHDALRHNRLKRFVDKNGIARCWRCRRRKNKQPSRRNDSRTERIVAGIYEMNSHGFRPFPVPVRQLRRGTLLSKPALAIRPCSHVRPTVGPGANASVQVRKQTILPACKNRTEQNCTHLKKGTRSPSHGQQTGS